MASSRKDSPVGTALAVLFVVFLLPAVAWTNYSCFMAEQRGTVKRTYWTGVKTPTHHQILDNGEELHAWNLWFGGFSTGTDVVKRGGSFWADSAPRTGPPIWKRILSFFLFVPVVLMPALVWVAILFGIIQSAWSAFSRQVRRARAVPRRGSGHTTRTAVSTTAVDA